MQRSLEQFNKNIRATHEMGALYVHLFNDLRLPNDLSDLLRSQLVYAVSALDKLIHELVRVGMLQAFNGQRPKTQKFNNFSISLATLHKIEQLSQQTTADEFSFETPEYFLEQEIIVKHKYLAFQEPDKIADALSFIWEEKQKWQKIAETIGPSDDSVKRRLKAIVSRRNQIVHEADINIQTGERNEIDAHEVADAVTFIGQLGEKIYQCCLWLNI